MKLFKKALSICLSATILAGISTTSYALPINPIVKETAYESIATTSDENFTYTSIYNKNNNTIQLITTNNKTGDVKEGDITPIRSIEEFNNQTEGNSRASLQENTWSNYEYTITYGTTNKWQLRRPDDIKFNWVYFDTYETEDNKEYLDAFKKAVDEVNIEEGAVVTAIGLTGLSVVAAAAAGAGAIFTGGTLSAAAWQAILASAGFGSAAVAACMAYDQSCKDAFDAYWKTYYNSDIL